MDDLHLSDTLQGYFLAYFLSFDEDKSGEVDVNKLLDLIKSGNVPEEVIHQIIDTCLLQGVNNLNKKQFYSALKLVAAYQANVPVRAEVLGSDLDLPLPRFTWPEIRDYSYKKQMDSISTDSEVDSETLSVGHNGSPAASSTASDSPTPTNSVQDKGWAVGNAWQGLLVSEEQRQLLEESSDRHSSEEDAEVSSEVWTITPEQREYYTIQFKKLQPDVKAVIAGPVARCFFEKSRLPVQELRKIWQLSDVTKDGALSLEEFNIAMHLVVLRRNRIELPDTLPSQLALPGGGAQTPASNTPEADPPLLPIQAKDSAKEWTKFIESPTSSVSSPGPKPVNFDFQKGAVEKDPKILHPVALRLTPEVLSAQNEEADDGNSPMKFLEVNTSDTTKASQNSAIQRPQPKKYNIPGPGAIPPPPQTVPASIEEGPVSLPSFPPPKKEKPPPPPPRPFKTHGRSSSLDLNRLNKNLAPPSVPPRVSPNVQQSVKKLINQKSEGDSGGKQTGEEFANFDQFEKYENVPEDIFPGDQYEAERKKLFAQFSVTDTNADATDSAPRKHGAFEIYRKPTPKNRESPATTSCEDREKCELFARLQEENTVLLRLCQELSQELAEVKEKKVALKVRLEKQLNGG